jgi:membrane fusion protein (multidrug efflux system)
MSALRLSIRPLVAVISTLLLGVAACGGPSKAEDPPAMAPTTISPENVVVMAEQRIRTGPSLSGDLLPEREAVIRAELGGGVTSVQVEAGQAVRAGQILGTLDGSVVEDQYRSATSAVVSAESAAQVARRELERSQRLLTGGAIAERDLEIAERTLRAAEAQLENARAGQAAAEKQLAKTRLRAPFNGVVSERTVSVGDIVQSGNALFTVVDPTSMKLEASVPVSALSQLTVGAIVEFGVSGYDSQAFTGRIQRINPTVDPGTRQVRLTVSIPNPGHSLVAGLFAKGRVSVEEKQALAVPLSAVDQRGPTPTLRRIHLGKVEVVAVQLGLRDEILELVEVVAGLAPGDSVLLAGAQGIAAGTPVLVTKE